MKHGEKQTLVQMKMKVFQNKDVFSNCTPTWELGFLQSFESLGWCLEKNTFQVKLLLLHWNDLEEVYNIISSCSPKEEYET